VWARAREKVLPPESRATELARRPYDLRHAAVSWWLASGVDPQTVARRAGHTVTVLFRVYAKFIEGADDAANAKISARLRQRS
jgi:integrase